MEKEDLNPKKKQKLSQLISKEGVNAVGIDLEKLKEEHLIKLLLLLDEIDYTPIKVYKTGPGIVEDPQIDVEEPQDDEDEDLEEKEEN